MAKSGRRGLPPHIKRQRGETRPSRQTVLLFPGVDPSTVAGTPPPAPPSGMSPAARRVWVAKAQRYHARGMRVGDYTDTLRAFCELEAALNAGVAVQAGTDDGDGQRTSVVRARVSRNASDEPDHSAQLVARRRQRRQRLRPQWSTTGRRAPASAAARWGLRCCLKPFTPRRCGSSPCTANENGSGGCGSAAPARIASRPRGPKFRSRKAT